MENMDRCEICGSAESEGGLILWGCGDGCGIIFCERCFADSVGSETAHEMFSMDGSMDDILCPTCYKNSLQQRGRE